jgi:hypothetical protein
MAALEILGILETVEPQALPVVAEVAAKAVLRFYAFSVAAVERLLEMVVLLDWADRLVAYPAVVAPLPVLLVVPVVGVIPVVVVIPALPQQVLVKLGVAVLAVMLVMAVLEGLVVLAEVLAIPEHQKLLL